MFSEGVQIGAEGAMEDYRVLLGTSNLAFRAILELLRDQGEVLPQRVQADRCDVHAVHADASLAGILGVNPSGRR